MTPKQQYELRKAERQRRREAKEVLDEFGYKPPRWWEYWRWGEAKP